MPMHRRDVLRLAAAAAPLAYAGRLWAAPQTSTRLLVVFLRGAYDAASVVVPVGSDFYYQSRPTIRIVKPDPNDANSALPLDADWGLHPALKQSVYPLWQKGQVAFVPYAGTDDLTRSHFETQDTIELGQPIDAARDYRSGFLNRLYGQLSGRGRPIAFTADMPLSFRGGQPVPNVSVGGKDEAGVDDRQAELIMQMYQGQPLQKSVAEGFEMRRQVSQALSGEMMAASRGAVSAKGFELAARRIGRLMQADYNLAFVDVGGWDTHVNQGSADGYLANQLTQLGSGLSGFVDEIGPAWNDTVVVVISEFGRTFHENGDRGTDHGHGSVYWVMGGGVKGGRLVGDQVKLAPETLNQSRDYPV
ncbi:MAG TPA: DUF1501 domain-containing protein, partial [Caulobacteraceae bacterium]|nr:DUF1501 domain-containing protein [Caulobacteraceae bacterium]